MDNKFFSDARFFHLMVQASPAGMVIVDHAGTMVLANAQVEEIFGYSEQELVGQPVEKLIPEAQARAHVTTRAHYLAHPETRSMAAGRDLFGRRKDGSQVPVDISLHPLETDQGLFVLANILDATQRRDAARRRQSQHAIERLAMMGKLAGGVAHEIRTPLCVIRNNTYFLSHFVDQLDDEARECLQEIDVAIGTAERIVSELLDFTRGGPSDAVRISLGEIVDRALATIDQLELIELRPPTANRDLQVNVDPEQIQRVLVNLIRNSTDALCGAESQQGNALVEIRLGSDLGRVWIEVADNGPGIDQQARERVFEPLFTTKADGFGLGLDLCRRYAEAHGGWLELTDNQGGGACFRLTLPSPGDENPSPGDENPSPGDENPSPGDENQPGDEIQPRGRQSPGRDQTDVQSVGRSKSSGADPGSAN